MTGEKICILRSNPVNPDSRVEKIAWSLAKEGYNVQIVGWDRESNHLEEKGTVKVVDCEVPIVLFGHKASYGAGLKSLKPFIRFQFDMCKWLIKHRNEYAIIHGCDFDTALFPSVIAHMFGKKFVFDIFDFLCGEPTNFFQRLIKKMQLHIINCANATIICTEERKKQIAGSKPKKLVVIHNTPFKEQMNSNGVFLRKTSENIRIAYVGILADERLLTSIGKCISRHPEVELHIAGFGYLENYFIDLSEKFDNIYFYGKIPYAEALQLEKECDIMLAIYNPKDENCRFAAPNKFYESLMLGKPVMMAMGTGMSDVVEKNDIGVLIHFSEDGFEAGLESLIQRRAEWKTMSLKMMQIYESDYNWGIMRRRLAALYESL